ncbi:MAG: signal peptidase I, partial [Ruminococcaceae bacterium]|nr:signal peptidase I [Oscillospiraceae bacterium]
MWDEEKDKSETMEAIDPSKYMSDQSGYFKHREEEDNVTMDAIDPEEYKKALESTDKKKFEEEISPIEVKSTRHLELQQRQEETKENAHTAANEVFDWLESILTAVITIVLIFTFIIRINTVDGDSMNPTLTAGQKLVVSDLFYTPDYNDIVIVQAAKLDGGKPIVKRIIGLPGDTIKIDFESGTVYRNGTALTLETRSGIIYEDGHAINTVTTLRQDMLSNVDYTVPEGSYFVMGDNRNNSKDSRLLSVIGFIDKNYIAGR